MLQLIESTVTDVAKKETLTEEMVQSVVDSYPMSSVSWKRIKRIGLLGIDEISLKKGHQDCVILISSYSDDEKQLLAVIPGKEKAAISGFLRTIPNKKQKTITAVCTDLCDNFINAVKETLVSDIPIVSDRFHIAKLYRTALDQLRSQELKRLKKTLGQEAYQELKPAIKILVTHHECYSKQDKKILEPLFRLSPAIKASHRLAREFTPIDNAHHRKPKAEKKLIQWIHKVSHSDVHCFDRFIKKTLPTYQDMI